MTSMAPSSRAGLLFHCRPAGKVAGRARPENGRRDTREMREALGYFPLNCGWPRFRAVVGSAVSAAPPAMGRPGGRTLLPRLGTAAAFDFFQINRATAAAEGRPAAGQRQSSAVDWRPRIIET